MKSIYPITEHIEVRGIHSITVRNYSGEDTVSIHPILVTCDGTTAAMMQWAFAQSW